MPRFTTLLLLSLLLSSALAHSGHHSDVGDGDVDEAVPKDDVKRSLHSRPLILVKVWCLILIFIGTFLGGLSPYFLKWDERFLVIGTQFAGGVFLGTALMHFLSDANETFEDLTEKKYPFAFMLACFGYLLTMLADAVVSHVFSKKNGGDESGGSLHNLLCYMPQQNRQSPHHINPAASVADVDSVGDSILLIAALCFHSVFEGIAIGVAETKADAWKALWTISLHKIFAAIAMGIALLRMIPNRPLLSCAAYAFAFAISSPVGVGIGIIIDATTQGPVADWVFAISMGLACGVFIYVSINHLLAKGYKPHKSVNVDKSHLKFLAVLLGIGVISVVMIWD
ncbi:Zinc/iron permease [Parasponia andersonii]|uniref:Zinc/iron permease n=1 Tax=Parasponia andersonii TaxID=3476 RepID=A0A2P5AA03_PARAD|nr:Zinc/iron permease [Parasponia andersonii]